MRAFDFCEVSRSGPENRVDLTLGVAQRAEPFLVLRARSACSTWRRGELRCQAMWMTLIHVL